MVHTCIWFQPKRVYCIITLSCSDHSGAIGHVRIMMLSHIKILVEGFCHRFFWAGLALRGVAPAQEARVHSKLFGQADLYEVTFFFLQQFLYNFDCKFVNNSLLG